MINISFINSGQPNVINLRILNRLTTYSMITGQLQKKIILMGFFMLRKWTSNIIFFCCLKCKIYFPYKFLDEKKNNFCLSMSYVKSSKCIFYNA